MQATQPQVPVTCPDLCVTLLNRILTEQHGHKIIIEKSRRGIDNELLVADTNEQIVETNNWLYLLHGAWRTLCAFSRTCKAKPSAARWTSSA